MKNLCSLDGKKVLVAGSNGMVGSAVCRKLKERNCKIIQSSRSEIDFTRQLDVEKWISTKKPDIIIICAAKVGGILANDSFSADFIYENLLIECNLIKAAHQNKIQKLLFLGSSCIYPKFAMQPMDESLLMSGPLEQTNESYAVAKIAGIKLCEAFRKQYKSDFISALPCNLYGPGDNYDLESSHVLPALIRKCLEAKLRNLEKVIIWGTGKVKREFMYVDDCAEAILFLIENYSDSSPINIGTGEEIKISELASLIKKLVSFDGKFEFDPSKPDGTPRKLLNNHKILELGWKPKISLKEGILSTINSLSADFK